LLHRLSWLKTGVVFVLIVLFFVIVNGFFNENKNLLKEQIFWQNKAKSLQEFYNQAQAENEVLRGKLDDREQGLYISEVQLESAAFIDRNGNNVTYSLLIEVVNKSKQRSAGATGFVTFAILNQSGKNISTTSWRSFALPALNAGETKIIRLSGKILGRSQAKVIIFGSILGEPGVAKLLVTLPKKPAPSPPPPKREETRKVETKSVESKKEKSAEEGVKPEESPGTEPKIEAPKKNEGPRQGELLLKEEEGPGQGELHAGEKENIDAEQPLPPASAYSPEQSGAGVETVS